MNIEIGFKKKFSSKKIFDKITNHFKNKNNTFFIKINLNSEGTHIARIEITKNKTVSELFSVYYKIETAKGFKYAVNNLARESVKRENLVNYLKNFTKNIKQENINVG